MTELSGTGTRLRGKVAIVTGGSSGIGKEAAIALRREGAQVVVADLQASEAIASQIDASGEHVLCVTTDVRSDSSVSACIEACLRRFNRCDILVNNAGIATSLLPKPFEQLTPEEFHLVYDVNVVGIFRMCRAVVPHMEKNGGGRIINISSAAALKGIPFLLHYVSSKGAVIAMTRSLARELGDRNILVNGVAPGFTLTDATLRNQQQMATTRSNSLHGRALKRDEYPADVVGAVLFFAGGDSAFITGQTLVVDGGTHMA